MNRLFKYKSLTKDESKEVLVKLAKGEFNNSQMAAFLTVYLMRSITVDELEGFREAMDWYEKAADKRPHGIDDPILRWNSCLRTIRRSNLTPAETTPELPLE